MKAIICDKCKKVITDEKEIRDIVRFDLCTNYLGKYDEKHLCDDCKSSFFDWLKDKQVILCQ